jgi:hypothetical protein
MHVNWGYRAASYLAATARNAKFYRRTEQNTLTDATT